jgi:hypothetical protein
MITLFGLPDVALGYFVTGRQETCQVRGTSMCALWCQARSTRAWEIHNRMHAHSKKWGWEHFLDIIDESRVIGEAIF